VADEPVRVSVNVEAAIAHRLFREAEFLEEQVAALRVRPPTGDLDIDRNAAFELQRLELTLRRQRDTVRQAIAAAGSLDDELDPAELEPVTTTPFTDEEIAAREAAAEIIAWAKLEDERDGLLAATDWTQLPDAPVDREAWAAYRQALRDLPAKIKNPIEPEWPTPPA
jgi:hypothetical protein